MAIAGVSGKTMLLATFSLLLGACDVLGITEVCTSEPHAAIGVHLLDATTGAPPAADSARIVVRDGAYVDSATVSSAALQPGVLIAFAIDRAGTYSVEVEVPGYEAWTVDDIRVDQTDDGCHVETQVVVAELQPASADGD